MPRPRLSIVSIVHDMQREAPRSLYSMSARYQRGVSATDYEVIVVDNGSTAPLDPSVVSALGPQFRHYTYLQDPLSPVAAIRYGVEHSRGDTLAIHIDGARMLSPGVIAGFFEGFARWPHPLLSTLGWHLGPALQNESMLHGYDQQTEDQLLASIGWPDDGYALFNIATLAHSSAGGWFHCLRESNFLALRREDYDRLGGYDIGFRCAGGGLANLDFYRRASLLPGMQVVHLLGEGSFHQFHGGVATNVPLAQHPDPLFQQEYFRLRGERYAPAQVPIEVLGELQSRAATAPHNRAVQAMQADVIRRATTAAPARPPSRLARPA